MYRLFRNRKGVSPLIATVLLIAFAVALGAVVMNWGRSYVEDTAAFARSKSDTEVKCSTDATLEFLKVHDQDSVCLVNSTTPKYFNFTVENTGTATLYGMVMDVIGDADVNETQINFTSGLGRASLFHMSQLNYSDDVGTAQQLKITPMIQVSGTLVACPSAPLIEENFRIC